VGGHAGIQTTEDGSLLIKPALKREVMFYEAMARGEGGLAGLREYVPKFLGVLKLEGRVGEDGTKIEEVADGHESIVLENLTYGFSKPNILDIKLGRELYDSEASEEKIERMKKAARETTSWETGVRLTGFQVYDNVTGEAVNTPKSYGKSIKASELKEGIARFFPVGDAEGARSGLGRSVLVGVLEGIRDEVAAIREIVASLEVRMVGASVLIVYDSEQQYVVRLIDFAHTFVTPGSGPDDGVLLGLDTTLGLLNGRIAEI